MPAFSKPKLVDESTFHFKNNPYLSESNNKIIYSVSIPYPVCKQWHEAVGSSIPGYINLLNSFLAENLLTGDVAQERLGVVEHDLASAHEKISDLESATSI